MRTPPVDISAERRRVDGNIGRRTQSGCCPPMSPRACSVIMLEAVEQTALTTALLPCTVRLIPTSAIALPPTSAPPPVVPGAIAPG